MVLAIPDHSKNFVFMTTFQILVTKKGEEPAFLSLPSA